MIAYDGSASAEATLDDLQRAGLPTDAEAMVISVAELWFSAPPLSGREMSISALSADSPSPSQQPGRSDGESEAVAIAEQGADRVRRVFPKWEVTAEACIGSPATQILERAEQWNPDLIVVGSHGRSALGRLVLGSVSQKIVTGARCSVRIGRGKVEVEDPKARILIATDGFEDSDAAVKAVAARLWPQGSQARLLTAIGPFFTGVQVEEEKKMAEEIQHTAAVELQESGLEVSFLIKEADPRRLIIDEAEKWGADSIFVGSSGIGGFERLLVGSVSAAVAARSHCSVEVVRADRDKIQKQGKK